MAFNKTVKQSSIYDATRPPSNGNDNNDNTIIVTNNEYRKSYLIFLCVIFCRMTLSHTPIISNLIAGPFWEVDLGQTVHICWIEVTHRTETSYRSRLSNSLVSIMNELNDTVASYHTGTFSSSDPVKFNISAADFVMPTQV